VKIELRDLALQYDDKPPLFQNLDLTLERGDFLLIQGPSGCGKSSLLRLINRLQEPSSGQVLIDGQPVADRNIHALRRRIAYVQQTPVVIPGSVADNLHFPFSFKLARGTSPPSPDELRRWLDDFLLDQVQLEDDASRLSVGQQQRLALIRILLIQPDFLLCDEPTSALDPQSKEIVEQWLERTHTDQGIGVVLVTHLDYTPRKIQPRCLILKDGVLQEVAL